MLWKSIEHSFKTFYKQQSIYICDHVLNKVIDLQVITSIFYYKSPILGENKHKVKNMVKTAVVDGIEQIIPKVAESLQENVENAIQSHMRHEGFIVKAVQSSLLEEISECLRCIICKGISTSPVVISTCCESVIGCHQCAQTWLHSGKNSCPKCREEGFNSATISTRGFEDFLEKLHEK